METAYLTQAHDHARNAAAATWNNNLTTASVEHERAASLFKDATKETTNAEALRILSLLETHHHRLASIIKSPPARPVVTESADGDAAGNPPSQAAGSAKSPVPKIPAARTSSPSPSTSPPPRAPGRRRMPRDYTSTIANNLATARGIPNRKELPNSSPMSVTTAVAANRQAREEQGTPSRDLPRRLSQKSVDLQSKHDLPQSSKTEEGALVPARAASSDDGFKRFYSNIVGTVLSSIPAPLVFTSYPLSPGSSSQSKSTSGPPGKSRSSDPSRATAKPDELDLSKLISRTALQALKDEQGPTGPFANTESFYVVPTSGGTVSYAGILSQQHAHHHAAQTPHLADVEEEGSDLRGSSHEEFVDARDTPYPPSPTAPRHVRKSNKSSVTTARSIPAGRGAGLKTNEELQLENDTLKSLVDKLSKRLMMWEATSQGAYKSLAQSIRAGGLQKQASDPTSMAQAITMNAMGAVSSQPSTPPPVPTIPEHFKKQAADAEAEKRIKELEALLAEQSQRAEQLDREREELERQNEKNANVIRKYREQWEKLKAGARRKEKEREERKLAELREKGEMKEGEEAEKEEDEIVEEPGFGKA